MRDNTVLNNAQKRKNNEFYAVESELDKEIPFYSHAFNGKRILCNCNDGKHKGFVNYFKKHYDEFKIKELVYTEYGDGNENGKIYRYNGREEIVIQLDQKGDFRYGECLHLLQECDVVVTGPPYSLINEFIKLLFEYNKKFLIIADASHSSLVNIFSLLKKGKMWVGITNPEEFIIPDGYTDSTVHVAADGTRRCWLRKDLWFTNIKANKEKPFYNLTCEYSDSKYKKCDNFDAIWIKDIRQIPKDYNGIMCVACTFFRRWNPNQFEIVGRGVPYYENKRKYNRILIKKTNNMAFRKISDEQKKEFNKKVGEILFFMFHYCTDIDEFDDNDDYDWEDFGDRCLDKANYLESFDDVGKQYVLASRYAREFGCERKDIDQLPNILDGEAKAELEDVVAVGFGCCDGEAYLVQPEISDYTIRLMKKIEETVKLNGKMVKEDSKKLLEEKIEDLKDILINGSQAVKDAIDNIISEYKKNLERENIRKEIEKLQKKLEELG